MNTDNIPNGSWPAAMRKTTAANYLDISTRSLERLLSDGQLELIRIGSGSFRIRRSDLDEYLSRCPTGRGERPGG